MKTRPGRASYTPPGTPGVGPAASIDTNIHSVAELAMVATVNLIAPSIRIWINTEDSTEQVWQLLASDVSVASEGVQPPNDFNAVTNAKCWFRSAT